MLNETLLYEEAAGSTVSLIPAVVAPAAVIIFFSCVAFLVIMCVSKKSYGAKGKHVMPELSQIWGAS